MLFNAICNVICDNLDVVVVVIDVIRVVWCRVFDDVIDSVVGVVGIVDVIDIITDIEGSVTNSV